MKPQEILDLEKEIGMELEQAENEEKFKESHKATYLLNETGQIIGLQLWYSKLREVPATIQNIQGLEKLNLSGNKISQIPDWIGNLIHLTSLNLDANQISQIPDWVGNLIHLTSLNLGGNQISQIPDFVGNLINLKELDLSSNKISQIPDSIGNLVSLTSLDLSKNWDYKGEKISQIPDSIGNLVNLTNLSLGSNQLSQIPDFIGNLVNLINLSLGSNQLSQIPDSVGNLVNLTSLNLMSNQLSQIPDSIGNLVNLKELDLRYNQLSQIPDSIGNLVNLTDFNLEENQITEIPYSLTHLINLITFDIAKNPICESSEYKPLINPDNYNQVFKIHKLFTYLNEKRGIKTHTAVWEMSEELQTVMKQFLEGFVDFSYRLYGEKPTFEVRRIAVGLELQITTSPTLSIEQINEALKNYTYVLVPNGEYAFTENTYQTRAFNRRHEYEILALKIRMEGIMDENRKHKDDKLSYKEDIERLNYRIQYFEEHTEKLTQIILNQQHQLTFKGIDNPLQNEIRDLVADNRLEKVFEKLDLHFKTQKDMDLLNQLIECKSAWNMGKEKYNSNLINEENHNIALAKIRKTLLDLAGKV